MKAERGSTFLIASLVIASGWATICPAALADEIQQSRMVTTDGSTQTETTTTTSSGTTDLNAPSAINEPSMMVGAIGNRRELLEQLISDELAKGHLSEAQAANLRAQLDAQKATATKVTTTNVTTYKVLPMATDLDAISARLQTYSPTVKVTPLIVQNRFFVAEGKYVDMNDLLYRRLGLEAKISRAMVYGQLNSLQAADLRAQLDLIASEEASFRSGNGGGLSDREAKRLYTEYDRVGSRIDHLISTSRIHVIE